MQHRISEPPKPCDPNGDLRIEDCGGLIGTLAPHQVQLIVGLDMAALAEQVALAPPSRPVLSLATSGLASAEAVIGSTIVQLAAALRGLWPHPWGEDFSAFRGDALSLRHLPIRIAGLAERLPQLSRAWASKAVGQLVSGRPPRLQDAPPALEWAQLVLATAPRGLIVATSLQPDRLAAQVRAIEWLAQHAPVSIVALADREHESEAIDRIAYGAKRMAGPLPRPSNTRVDAEGAALGEAPVVLTLPPAPEGQPHPMSPIEQKLYRLIQADDELRPLFVFNKTVPLPLLVARIDLVWLDGRVAIEIDGHEHRTATKFRADRHRDYELMCAGYRVLRMTNDDVETDTPLAIEKIRRVTRLALEEAR